MDVIIEKLIEFLPFWYLLSLFVIVGLIMFYYKFLKPMHDRTVHADCENNKKKMDDMASDMKQIRKDLGEAKDSVSSLRLEMNNSLHTIREDMLASFSELKVELAGVCKSYAAQKVSRIKTFGMKKSPIRLNETGERMFAEFGGKQFLDENKAYLFDKIDASKPKTALDVETSANLACLSATDDECFNRLKDFVYNCPSLTINDEDGKPQRYDLTLGDVCFILSIPLRDMYLEAHPSILKS